MRYCYCEAKVRSSNVSVVYVVRLRILNFSKAALQKSWGSMEPIEPPLDPPLSCVSWCLISSQCLKCVWCHTVKFLGCLVMHYLVYTVEPRLTDTLQQRTPTILQLYFTT